MHVMEDINREWEIWMGGEYRMGVSDMDRLGRLMVEDMDGRWVGAIFSI